MPKRQLIVSAPERLFRSFFSEAHQRRLRRTFVWQLNSARSLNFSMKQRRAAADAMVTTWDSPGFGDDLLQIAPKLRVIAHCGGEVRKRFGGSLLDHLTVTTAPEPMARATAELGAALVL